MVLASRTARLGAQMLDGIVAVAPAALALAFFGRARHADAEFFGGLIFLTLLLFVVLYVLFCDCLPGGQSVGKRMLGLAVIDRRTGRPCSPVQSLGRNLLLGILGLFDWIFIFGEQRQRLGDMIAGTIVVEAGPAGVPYQVRYQ